MMEEGSEKLKRREEFGGVLFFLFSFFVFLCFFVFFVSLFLRFFVS